MEKSGVARHRSARDATPTRQQGDTRAPIGSQPRATGATGRAWARGGEKRGEAEGWSIDEDRPEKLLFWKGNRRGCSRRRGILDVQKLSARDIMFDSKR